MPRRELRLTASTWVLAAERVAASDLCPRPAGEERVRDQDGGRLLDIEGLLRIDFITAFEIVLMGSLGVLTARGEVWGFAECGHDVAAAPG
jgi:hypothetical protein